MINVGRRKNNISHQPSTLNPEHLAQSLSDGIEHALDATLVVFLEV
jgi:hypothetical protein